jgi:macrolide transport system ATP-binding/permease protein
VIELKNITKTYRPGDEIIRALDGVSLTIGQGDFVAIMGTSGSGKSTMMQILGLLDSPTGGEYKLFGKDVAKLDEDTLAGLRSQHFGFVFQQFFLLPKMTALENVALPLLYAGKTGDKISAVKSLERVGLANRAEHQPNQMSGGQQQRVAIARALVNNPQIIFADEPTGNLDSKTKVEIMEQLKALNESGKTVILVTHEEEMARYAKRVITMRDGKIISDTAPTKNMGDEKLGAPEAVAPHKIHFFDYIKQAFTSIWSHKTRSFLSVLGILIGVAAVIAMMALGSGANDAMQKQLSSLGSNLLMVRPGQSSVGGVALASGSTTRLTLDDAHAVEQQLDGLDGVSGFVSMRVQVVANGNNANTEVDGVEQPYETIRAVTPVSGRWFTPAEQQAGAKVALLGSTVIREIYGSNNPVGQTVRINETYFNVIGVLPTRGVSGPRDQDDQIIIPLKTGMKRLMGKDYIDTIFINVKDAKNVDDAQDKLLEILNRRHRVVDPKQQPFEIRNMADIKNTLEGMTRTMSGLLGTVAAISLVVGGIGIMNIMLVAVVERTKEIGLRKAIGATKVDILYQFLFESVLLSLIGGLLGVALGAGVSLLMATVLGWAVSVSLFSVLLSTGFSFVVGLVFGLWPAMKASDLSPIVALRYE